MHIISKEGLNKTGTSKNNEPIGAVNVDRESQKSINENTATLVGKTSQTTKIKIQTQTQTHKIKTQKQRQWICQSCNLCFKTRSLLRTHLKERTKGEVAHRCDSCEQVFCFAKDLENHVKVHSAGGVQEGSFTPGSDQAENLEVDEFMESDDEQGLEVSEWVCDKCGIFFRDSQSLEEHKSSTALENSSHKCFVCKKEFCLKKNVVTHLAVHCTEAEDKKVKCERCQKKLPNKHAVRQHLLKSLKQNGFNPCSKCEKKFCLSLDLERHISGYHSDMPFKCGFCDVTFEIETDIIEHCKTEHSEAKFKCVVCGYINSKLYNIRKHYKSHNTEKSFLCEICGNGYHTNKGLSRHKTLQHGRPLLFDCDKCGKKCRTKTQLRCHQVFKHGYKSKYGCLVCGKSLPTPSALKLHLQVHTGDRPHNCEYCSNRFRSKLELNGHLAGAHEINVRHRCSFCDKPFYSKPALKIHLRRHMGIKPCVCDVCGKSFVQKNGLKDHIRQHTGETPYECEICKKRFKNASNFKLHKRFHSGIKPYECSQCHKRFINSSNYNKHMKVHRT